MLCEQGRHVPGHGKNRLGHAIEQERAQRECVGVACLAGKPDAVADPALDAIDRIEEDYRGATDAPPLPPQWLQAVDSVAAIPRNGDATVCEILDNIGESLEKAHQETQKAYRQATLERHKLLGGMHNATQAHYMEQQIEERLGITDHSWEKVSHLYQSFQQDDDGKYMCNILFEGEKSEHEEETGRITLHDHPFNKDIEISEVYEQPFREMWMREGHQLFDPLRTL